LCGAFRVFVNDAGHGRHGAHLLRRHGRARRSAPRRSRRHCTASPGRRKPIEAAVAAFAEDYQPISDMRASKEYRLLAAQNLLQPQRFYPR
jgi:xanthine dehydrogenase small subunit